MFQAFRVKESYKRECFSGNLHSYRVVIDENGIDDPTDKRELILIETVDQELPPCFIAFYLGKIWVVQGNIKSRRLLLFEERQ